MLARRDRSKAPDGTRITCVNGKRELLATIDEHIADEKRGQTEYLDLAKRIDDSIVTRKSFRPIVKKLDSIAAKIPEGYAKDEERHAEGMQTLRDLIVSLPDCSELNE